METGKFSPSDRCFDPVLERFIKRGIKPGSPETAAFRGEHE